MRDEKLDKHTLRLRAGDVEFIRDRFPKPGANAIIRRIISNFVDKINQVDRVKANGGVYTPDEKDTIDV
jgi:hypothetical protein